MVVGGSVVEWFDGFDDRRINGRRLREPFLGGQHDGNDDLVIQGNGLCFRCEPGLLVVWNRIGESQIDILGDSE